MLPFNVAGPRIEIESRLSLHVRPAVQLKSWSER